MSSFAYQISSMEVSTAEVMGQGAARSLDLLTNIDVTIASLTHHSQLLGAVAHCFSELAKRINSMKEPAVLPEENLVPNLEALQVELAKGHAVMSKKRKSAIDDKRLQDEDGVVDAYDILLDAVCSLNTAAEQLRWSLMECNADAEGEHTPVLLSEPEDIDRFLDSL